MSKIMFMDNEYGGNYVGLIDFFYPIGSYYETSDTSFNPNTTWGGTWVLEAAGQVHVSAGTDYEVSGANDASGAGNSDGGGTTKSYTPTGSVSVSVANHTLVASEIPTHNHGSKTLTGGWKDNSMCSLNSVNKLGNVSGIVTRATSKGDQYYTTSGRTKTANQYDEITITATHTHDNYGGGGAHGHAGSTGSFSGTTANINVMQPYIIVNRWHRTA